MLNNHGVISMSINPIAIAVPIFFILMFLEYWIAHRQQRQVYRINDAFSDVACGVGDQSIALFLKIFKVGIFTMIAEFYSVLTWNPKSIMTWVIGFVAVDFCFYWYHRFSHRVHFAWTTHVVHHQSEDYNFAVALRQPWFAQLYAWIFYIPLAFLGVPPIIYVTCYSLNLLYQFLLHTRLVRFLGWIEWIMNTPSHHRVHHGVNEKYLDKNYAGVFIIWDRLFNTFKQEEEEPDYGVLKPMDSWNPFWLNVSPIIGLIRRAGSMTKWSHKIWIFFAPPAWVPGQGEVLPSFPDPKRGYDKDRPYIHFYLLSQMLPLVMSMTWLLWVEVELSVILKASCVVFLLWTMISWSALIETQSWGFLSETLRVLTLCLFGSVCLLLSYGHAYHIVQLSVAYAITIIGVLSMLVWVRIARAHS
jgi:alkylglycerol monooxygenase